MVACPICDRPVKELDINRHIDSECRAFIDEPSPPPSQASAAKPKSAKTAFFTPATKRALGVKDDPSRPPSSPLASNPDGAAAPIPTAPPPSTAPLLHTGDKRPRDDGEPTGPRDERAEPSIRASKKAKTSHAPLAERMRPRSLDEVAGQALVGPEGVLRNLIVTDRVPSMILWGGPGTGKTTIARLIAQRAGTRFVEINSTSSGVAECKKLFAEARHELGLTGRKTIIFCDEIHRFSKSQQDVFLAPVEAGQVTLIGATTENPSFKVVNALLSRCRTFTLAKLTDDDVCGILTRALAREVPDLPTPSPSPSMDDGKEAQQDDPRSEPTSHHLLTDDDSALLKYLSAFADGDARTGLNLLELALDLCQRPSMTAAALKKSLTQTLVYDRAGDQHYDTISAFHKSIRGSAPDAALYYLARMLQSGEDPLYVARRLVVIASEDVGLADNTLLPLATAAHAAAHTLGWPECRIPLAHCAVALALAPKSTRAYRGLAAAAAALDEPGVAGLPVPVHLRNAPTRLLRELGHGREYKYNPDYVDGRVVQDYLPARLVGRSFLPEKDLGDDVDPEVAERDARRPSRAGGEREVDPDALLNPDGD